MRVNDSVENRRIVQSAEDGFNWNGTLLLHIQARSAWF
jgi:hypothetical protein